MSELPFAIAHRGGGDCCTPNTMPAFMRAIELGYKRLETDVRYTEAGQLLAIHGERADGTTGADWENSYIPTQEGPRPIQGLTPAQRLAVKNPSGVPYAIPTMEELLDIDPDVHWNIDAKHPEAVQPLLELLRKLDAFPRVTLASFNDQSVAELRAGAPAGTSSALSNSELSQLFQSFKNPTTARNFPPNSRAQVPYRTPHSPGGEPIVTEERVAAAHAQGVPVDVWTVNDETDMNALIAMGVDGIFTDQLQLLRDQLIKAGRPL